MCRSTGRVPMAQPPGSDTRASPQRASSGPSTSTEARMQQVAAVASGYVYYVSLKGVTGAGHLDTDAVEAALPRIRQHVHIPVGVGFGIRDAQTAVAVSRVADAVVIGSKIIQLIDGLPRAQAITECSAFLSGIRSALDQAPSFL